MSSNDKKKDVPDRIIPDHDSGIVTEPESVNTSQETSNHGCDNELNANSSDLYSGVRRHTRNAIPETRSLFPTSNVSRNMDHCIHGCARTTPILNQRFGINFTRRYTMPHGAPYPLRPSPDLQNYRSVFPNSSSSQTRSQKQFHNLQLQSPKLSNQKQEFIQASVSHISLQTPDAHQAPEIQGLASEVIEKTFFALKK